MQEQLEIVRKVRLMIDESRAIISDVKKRVIESHHIKVGDKVLIRSFLRTGEEVGTPKKAFVGNIMCGRDLEISYSFLGIKKDGTVSKNSAGIYPGIYDVVELDKD